MQANKKPTYLLNPEDIEWTREVQPRERYRIVYRDSAGEKSVRAIELLRQGHHGPVPYLGVMHEGKFKTFRSDRVLEVQEQLTTGHAPSLHAAVTYATQLPPWPLEQAIFRVETVAVSNRTWCVDLHAYTCTCSESRRRRAKGYQPGQVGFVCPHIARAILKHLPAEAEGWTTDLRGVLADPRKVHVDNLHPCSK